MMMHLIKLSFLNAMAFGNDMFIDFSIDLHLIIVVYMHTGLDIDLIISVTRHLLVQRNISIEIKNIKEVIILVIIQSIKINRNISNFCISIMIELW